MRTGHGFYLTAFPLDKTPLKPTQPGIPRLHGKEAKNYTDRNTESAPQQRSPLAQTEHRPPRNEWKDAARTDPEVPTQFFPPSQIQTAPDRCLGADCPANLAA